MRGKAGRSSLRRMITTVKNCQKRRPRAQGWPLLTLNLTQRAPSTGTPLRNMINDRMAGWDTHYAQHGSTIGDIWAVTLSLSDLS